MTILVSNKFILPAFSGLILHGRPGFETELEADFIYRSTTLAGTHSITERHEGLLITSCSIDAPISERSPLLLQHLQQWWPQWIFARQVSACFAFLPALNTQDRIQDLIQAIPSFLHVCDVVFESTDSNEGKSLSRLFKALEARLTDQLRQQGTLRASAPFRLHLVFRDGQTAWLGLSPADASSPWPMGIPRLKMPGGAPSRSTLKLDEALQWLREEDRIRLLKPGMKVVDLGAAPGGWTWQMVQRGMLVTAVDHGSMDKALMQSGMVEHVSADGFVYRPRKTVDWLLCDMVEQPRRIAQLLAQWLQQNHARCIIANLKLPMKRRWEEVQLCLDILHKAARSLPSAPVVRARQLYHDREEITIWVLPSRSEGS